MIEGGLNYIFQRCYHSFSEKSTKKKYSKGTIEDRITKKSLFLMKYQN